VIKKVAVIIPAYNEEGMISQTIEGLRSSALVDRVIVVDDGSRDNTPWVAKMAGAEVIKAGRNNGKGQALNLGIKNVDADIVAFMDADVGCTSAEVDKLLGPIIRGEADMTVAVFPPAVHKGGFGLVKGLARYTVKRYTGQTMTACLSGQRALSREVLKAIGKIPEGYSAEVGVNIKAITCGFRVLEVPVDMRHRETRRDLQGFIHRGRQFIDILKLCLGGGGQQKWTS
jgi:glycosyltransferase involved in cell wall biosynthesis